MSYAPRVARTALQQPFLSTSEAAKAAGPVDCYLAFAENPLSFESTIALAERCVAQKARHSETLFKNALALCESDGRHHLRCAALAARLGLADIGFECCVKAARDERTRREAYIMLSRLFSEAGEIDAGLRLLELTYDPSDTSGNYEAAVAESLFHSGRFLEALEWARKSHASSPREENLLLIARCLCTQLNTFEEGVSMFEVYLSEHPDSEQAYVTLTGALLKHPEFFQRCAQWCERGIRIFPAAGYLHFHYAWTLLSSGRWKEGWNEYEWRWSTPRANYDSRFLHPLGTREWRKNRSKPGGRVFVHGEQGFGDNFMFAKLVPRLHEFFDEIVLGVYPDLRNIFHELHIADDVTGLLEPWPEFDAHVAIGSLPLALEVFSLEETRQICNQSYRPVVRLPHIPPLDKPRIGLVWGGNPLGAEDARSIPEEDLRKFASEDNDAHMVFLQQGLRNFMLDSPLPEHNGTIDLRDSLGSWEQTAQVLMQLDGLVTIDTGVAHLGGLLGIPTAIVLPPTPDWRWLNHILLPEFTSSCLWYPDARLVRIEPGGGYYPALKQACASLVKEARTKRNRCPEFAS